MTLRILKAPVLHTSNRTKSPTNATGFTSNNNDTLEADNALETDNSQIELEKRDKADTPMERIVKLIPAEAIAVYIGVQNLLTQEQTQAGWQVWLAYGCLLLTFLVRIKATKGTTDQAPQWAAIFISMVAFCLWVLSLEAPVGPYDLGENSNLPAIGALIFSTLVPLFYEGD